MLALDKPLGVVAGLALFGDHAEPNRVHYAPTRPGLAKTATGKTEFSLIKFQSADATEEAKALLSFTADLSVSESQRETVLEWLEDHAISEALLTPVTWTSGKVYLASALHEGDGFAEKIHGESIPNLMGDSRAVITASLTEDGAAVIESLLQNPGPSAIGIRYALEYEGIRPALEIKIRADYQRIYKEFSWGFEIGVAYEGVGVRASVESATKKLVESGAIEIDVLHFTDDADFKKRVDEALLWLQDKLLEDFFRDSLQPPAHQNLLDRAIAGALQLGAATLEEALADNAMAQQLSQMLGVSTDSLGAMNRVGQTGGGQSSQSTFALKLQFQLKDIKEEQLKTILIDWSEARAEKRTAAPQGLLSDFGADPRIVEAANIGSFWDRVDVNVRPLGDFKALGVVRLIVHMAYPNETEAVDGFEALVFDAEQTTSKRFARWTNGARPQYRIKSEVHFTDDGPWPGPPMFKGHWQDEESVDLSVHPMNDLPRIEVELLPGAVVFDETPQVQIEMRVDGQTTSSFQMSADKSTFHFRQRFAELKLEVPADNPDAEPIVVPRLVEARCKWFLDQGQPVQGSWVVVEGSTFLVPSPWQSRRELRIFPLLPDDTLQAIVNVSISEGGRKRTSPPVIFSAEQKQAQMISLPSLTTPAPPLQVSFILLREDGSTFIGEPFETTEPVIVIRDRAEGTRRVRVRLIAGDSLAQHAVLAVQVQLVDPESNAVIDEVSFSASSREPGALFVPQTDQTQRYHYRVVRYGLDARPVVSDTIVDDRAEILVPAAVPTIEPPTDSDA